MSCVTLNEKSLSILKKTKKELERKKIKRQLSLLFALISL
jgi:hypothetical protein